MIRNDVDREKGGRDESKESGGPQLKVQIDCGWRLFFPPQRVPLFIFLQY